MTFQECREHIQRSKRWRFTFCFICDLAMLILIFLSLAGDELPGCPLVPLCAWYAQFASGAFKLDPEQTKLFCACSVFGVGQIIRRLDCFLINKHIQDLNWFLIGDETAFF